MRHTMQMFNQVNKDGLQMEATVHIVNKGVFRGSVVVGGITIAKSQECTNKLAMRIVLERAKERLSKYCYSVIVSMIGGAGRDIALTRVCFSIVAPEKCHRGGGH